MVFKQLKSSIEYVLQKCNKWFNLQTLTIGMCSNPYLVAN